MLRVGALHVYPLKGAGGHSVRQVELDRFGLRWDRRWIVTDPGGAFLSQRELPRMALLGAAVDDAGGLTLTAPERPALPVPAAAGARTVTVWDDDVAALDGGDEAARWLSDVLGRQARLAFLPEDGQRQVDRTYARAGDQVGFADGFPLLVVGAASLAELNSRLATPLPMDRFRPNLVVEGAAPFAEDGWRRLRVGALELELVKPCARCTVTTVDQATGERGREPLATLASFRTRDGKVMFGVNAIHRGRGVLRVGDAVEVLS